MNKFQNNITPTRIVENKIVGLDVIKAISIVLVIAIHSGLWKVDFIASGLPQNVLQYGCRLLCEGVPIFVMVNGFLLLGVKKWDRCKHLHRTTKLLVILLIWMAILILLGASILGEELTIESFWNYYFATAIGSNYTGVLWFLENLIAVYLIFPVLKYIYDHNTKLFLYLFGIFAFYSVGTQTLSWITSIIELYTKIDMINAFSTFLNRFNPTGNGYYVYCFMLGGILYYYKAWIISRSKSLMLLGIVSSFCVIVVAVFLSYKTGVLQSTGFNYSSVFMTGIMLGLMGTFLPLKNKNMIVHKIIESIGSSTLGMFLLHFIFVWLINKYIILEDFFVNRLIKCALIVLLSYLTTIILKKIPLLRRIVA